MKRLIACLLASGIVAIAPGVEAGELPVRVYVPDQVCKHLFSEETEAGTEVCSFGLRPGVRHFDLDMLSGRGSFRIEAAFEDGVVFFWADCSSDPPGIQCNGEAWTANGRGWRRWESTLVSTGFAAIVQEGVTADMPAGGSIRVTAGPGDAGGFIVTADGRPKSNPSRSPPRAGNALP